MFWVALIVGVILLIVVCYVMLDAAAWDGIGFWDDDEDEEV